MEYHFQNHLVVTINAPGKPQYARYFDNEYARISATQTGDPSGAARIHVDIVDVMPPDLPAAAIRQTRHFKKLFRFDYAIIGAGTDNVRIVFKDHAVSRLYVTAVGVFLQAQVLEPLMYLSLLRQGVFLMHSAGVAKDGKAYLFPAHGGTGKTTTSMSLLSQGYDFLGDDLILVDPQAEMAFPYPRPLHIFTYNVQNLQGARLPFSLVFIVYFKNLLRYFLETLLRTEFLISTRVHADDILHDFAFAGPARLHNIIFLTKQDSSRSVDLGNDEVRRDCVETIVTAADLNESLFELITDADHRAEIRRQERKVADEMLQRCDYMGFLNTRQIDLKKAATFLEDVERPKPQSAVA